MKKVMKAFVLSILFISSIQFTPIALASASEVNPLENVVIDPETELPSFDSWEDANKYMEAVTEMVEDNLSSSSQSSIVPFSTNGTATVARRNYGTSSITLYLSYGTSSNSNTGRITYANPYTSLASFTLGVSWQQQYIHAQISSSGKDVYVTANGVLVFSMIVSGVLETFRENVNLSGDVAVIR